MAETIVIGPDITFVVAPEFKPEQEQPELRPEPKKKAQKPRTYCPDCAPCTPSRKAQLSGWTPKVCHKHAHCSDCGEKLENGKRYRCIECESFAWYGG